MECSVLVRTMVLLLCILSAYSVKARDPERVIDTIFRDVIDLNQDCARDTLCIEQLANGNTRVRAIKWGVVADSIDVCDSLKRVSNPRPAHAELVFAYRAYKRPRSAVMVHDAQRLGGDYAATLRVYGHLHQTDTGKMFPMLFRIASDRDFDQYDTLIVDDLDSMREIENVTYVQDTIDTAALVAFRSGVYDIRTLPDRNYDARRSTPTEIAPRMSTANPTMRGRATGMIRRLPTDGNLRSVLRVHPLAERVRVFSVIGELIREYAVGEYMPESVDDGLPPGTYLVVSSEHSGDIMVHVWQKGG